MTTIDVDWGTTKEERPITFYKVMSRLKYRPHLEGSKACGAYALVVTCSGYTTVSFYDSLEQATQIKTRIDQTGCGGQCAQQHYIWPEPEEK